MLPSATAAASAASMHRRRHCCCCCCCCSRCRVWLHLLLFCCLDNIFFVRTEILYRRKELFHSKTNLIHSSKSQSSDVCSRIRQCTHSNGHRRCCYCCYCYAVQQPTRAFRNSVSPKLLCWLHQNRGRTEHVIHYATLAPD